MSCECDECGEHCLDCVCDDEGLTTCSEFPVGLAASIIKRSLEETQLTLFLSRNNFKGINMKKHIYLYFSNLEQLRDLREDEKFEPLHEYTVYEYPLALRNEYGRITTYQNYYHILVGRLEQEGCPWCGSPADVVKLGNSRVVKLGNSRALGYTAYCIQCMQCGARGPALNVSETTHENTEMFHECMSLLWQRYKHRRAWDEGFENPYESNNLRQADEKINSEK